MSERKNAAAIIENSTVRPFIFMGHTFKCFYCLQYFGEIAKLLEHTSTHPVLDRETLLEKYITKNKRSLQVDISELKCRICKDYLEEIDDVKDHLSQRHDVKFYHAGNAMTGYHLKLQDGLFFCHKCNEKFHTFSLLNNHMNTHVGKVVCENCGAGFLNQRLLIKHMEVHDVLKFPCKECDKEFSKKSQLRYHIEVKHKGKMVKQKKCPHCPFEFKEHYTKMVHLRDVHGITLSFECHICKATLPNRRMLTQHRTKFHTERFRCDVCSKCFGMRCHLVQHMRGHSGERTFVCPICKNAFMHRMTLAKHIKRVHGAEYKFICAECGVGFNLRGELSKHVKEWHAEKKDDRN